MGHVCTPRVRHPEWRPFSQRADSSSGSTVVPTVVVLSRWRNPPSSVMQMDPHLSKTSWGWNHLYSETTVCLVYYEYVMLLAVLSLMYSTWSRHVVPWILVPKHPKDESNVLSKGSRVMSGFWEISDIRKSLVRNDQPASSK